MNAMSPPPCGGMIGHCTVLVPLRRGPRIRQRLSDGPYPAGSAARMRAKPGAARRGGPAKPPRRPRGPLCEDGRRVDAGEAAVPRVPVVDDDADIRAVLREAPEQEGH